MRNIGEELDKILKKLTGTQLKFVAARMHLPTDKEAALAIGLSPQAAYNWDDKDLINRAIELAHLSTIHIAQERLERLANTAVDVLEDEMKAGRATGNRFSAALQVLDRLGIVMSKKMDLDLTSGGKPIHTENTIIVREIVDGEID